MSLGFKRLNTVTAFYAVFSLQLLIGCFSSLSHCSFPLSGTYTKELFIVTAGQFTWHATAWKEWSHLALLGPGV